MMVAAKEEQHKKQVDLVQKIGHKRNQTYTRKLKQAYDSMLVFEAGRQTEKHAREELADNAKQEKLRTMAVNFQNAQNIRQREQDLKQARFFQKEVKKLITREENAQQNTTSHDELDRIGSQIDNLGRKEFVMLESL